MRNRNSVLLVDDDPSIHQQVKPHLERNNFDVSVATDGDAALDLFQRNQPTVVLLDIGMPGMNGYEVARELRRLPHGDAATILAITGFGQERDRIRSADARIDYHLLKPVDISVLATILKSIAPSAV